MRRVVIVMPSLFTLANLFFGIWAIVLASQGNFYRASWYIVIAGVLDVLDGLLARIGNAGTRFGAELDSLVDLVSFGVAPAMLMYYLVFTRMGNFAWIFSYGFVVCAALRLARYNLDTSGEHKASFSGLPSTAAGMTLATYYPFTQTAFFGDELAGLPWNQVIIYLTMLLSLAMVSNIRYARLPRIGLRTTRGLIGVGIHLIILWFGVWSRDIFFFPLGLAYVSYGLVRAALKAMEQRDPQLALHETDNGEQSWREPPAAGGA